MQRLAASKRAMTLVGIACLITFTYIRHPGCVFELVRGPSHWESDILEPYILDIETLRDGPNEPPLHGSGRSLNIRTVATIV